MIEYYIMKSCFFIGHRTVPDDIRERLDDAIERHITEYGVTEFLVGHYGAFDRMAQGALARAKERHPHIRLLLLLPYHPGEQTVKIPDWFDGSFYPPGMETVPRAYAIARANQYAIRTCDYLICYDARRIGNTRELVDLARRREKEGLIHIENLAE